MGLWKKIKKAAKSVGQVGAKVVKYGAPIAGGLVLGPLGAAGGTALAGAASMVGAKNKGAALKRTLVYGAGVTGATAVLGLASGAGIGSSVLNSASKIFSGGGGSGVTDQPKKSILDEAEFRGGPAGTGPQGGSNFGLNFNPFGLVPGARGGDASPGDPRQGGGFLDFLGGGKGGTPGFFQKQDGSPDLLKIGGAGFLAWYLFLRKKAA